MHFGNRKRKSYVCLKKPLKDVREDIAIITENNNFQLCCFSLCVKFKNRFDVRLLEELSTERLLCDEEKINMVKELCGECNIDLTKKSHRNELLYNFDILMDSYFVLEEKIIKIIPDNIFDIAAQVCRTQHASSSFISDRIMVMNDSDAHIQNEIFIPKDGTNNTFSKEPSVSSRFLSWDKLYSQSEQRMDVDQSMDVDQNADDGDGNLNLKESILHHQNTSSNDTGDSKACAIAEETQVFDL